MVTVTVKGPQPMYGDDVVEYVFTTEVYTVHVWNAARACSFFLYKISANSSIHNSTEFVTGVTISMVHLGHRCYPP